MANAIDLDYDPTSFVGPFELEEARSFEKWWLKSEYPFRLDESYLRHSSCCSILVKPASKRKQSGRK
jgi:hypothetical protein